VWICWFSPTTGGSLAQALPLGKAKALLKRLLFTGFVIFWSQ